jgi:hypothetical protein
LLGGAKKDEAKPSREQYHTGSSKNKIKITTKKT